MIFNIYYKNSGAPPRVQPVTRDNAFLFDRTSVGIDLAVAEDFEIRPGTHMLIPLNAWVRWEEDLSKYEQSPINTTNLFSMLVPRSSLFGKYKLIVVNSPGIIDSTYCGANDQIKLSTVYVEVNDGFKLDINMRDVIPKGEYIAQIIPMASAWRENVRISNYEDCKLGDDRGGFGSTG